MKILSIGEPGRWCGLATGVTTVVILALAACATPSTRPNLNSAEATRLADIKVQSLGRDLRRYDRSRPKYDASDDGWWINYWRKDKKAAELGFREFNILVKDKSKEAWLILP